MLLLPGSIILLLNGNLSNSIALSTLTSRNLFGLIFFFFNQLAGPLLSTYKDAQDTLKDPVLGLIL